MRAGAASARAFARSAAVPVPAPAILTCAVSGGVVTGNPNQPVTREQVIEEAVAAVAAGASVVHVHARGAQGEMHGTLEDYVAIGAAIRERAGEVLLNFSTGGDFDAPAEERRRSLRAGPELATLTCGSMNFGAGDDLLVSPRSRIAELAQEMARLRIVPEYECFDLGMAATAAELVVAEPEPRGMMHLLLGVRGGAPATAATVSAFVELVPAGIPWAVTALGRHFPVMALTLALGGHVRTGLEDVLYTAAGEHARSNAQLVSRARALCEAIGRPVATPAQARELLGARPAA